MKFKINRDHFVAGLQQVLNVVGTRATMPILNNVLIEAEGSSLSLTTTNLDLGIRCHIKAEVGEAGGITLPVRKLATIVKALPESEVTLDATDNQAKITSGGSTFRIMGMGKEEFPPLPTFKDQHEFTLKQESLQEMIRCVAYAQSNDENRHILNGMYFSFSDEKLTMVSTDGRRLAVMSEDMEVPEEKKGSLVLPAKTVGELQRLLGQGNDIKVSFNDRQVAFEIKIDDEEKAHGLLESTYLVSKIVEGNYPNYQQVVPKQTEHRVKIERELFQECIQRAALVTSEKNNSIKLRMANNLLEVTGSSPEVGEAHESMAIAYEGPEVQVAFNPQFLMDPLKALNKDEVFFEFKDDLSPGMVRTLDSFMCVIMPLRLN